MTAAETGQGARVAASVASDGAGVAGDGAGPLAGENRVVAAYSDEAEKAKVEAYIRAGIAAGYSRVIVSPALYRAAQAQGFDVSLLEMTQDMPAAKEVGPVWTRSKHAKGRRT